MGGGPGEKIEEGWEREYGRGANIILDNGCVLVKYGD